MTLHLELEQETDGRWIAELAALPGVTTYGVTKTDAVTKVQAWALRVLAARLEHGEAIPELLTVTFHAAWQLGRREGAPRLCCLTADWLAAQT